MKTDSVSEGFLIGGTSGLENKIEKESPTTRLQYAVGRLTSGLDSTFYKEVDSTHRE